MRAQPFMVFPAVSVSGVHSMVTVCIPADVYVMDCSAPVELSDLTHRYLTVAAPLVYIFAENTNFCEQVVAEVGDTVFSILTTPGAGVTVAVGRGVAVAALVGRGVGVGVFLGVAVGTRVCGVETGVSVGSDAVGVGASVTSGVGVGSAV